MIRKGGVLTPAYPNPVVPPGEGRRGALKPNRKGVFMNGYAHPEVLVETDWVQANLGRPGVKLVEIDVDNNNWFAANGFWLFKLYGHEDVRLMNGGRAKWQGEPDKEMTAERPSP